MYPYPPVPTPEAARIDALEQQMEAQKNTIREACLRLGKAYFDAHRADPEEVMEPDVRAVLDASRQIKSMQAEIRELKGLVICPECNSEISKDMVFCNICGHRMKEPEPEPVPEPAPAPVPGPEMPAAPIVCDNCGKTLKPGQRFCVGCGKAVSLMAIPQPAPAPAPEPRRCANCGAVLPDGARFCCECGTPA